MHTFVVQLEIIVEFPVASKVKCGGLFTSYPFSVSLINAQPQCNPLQLLKVMCFHFLQEERITSGTSLVKLLTIKIGLYNKCMDIFCTMRSADQY